MAIGEERQSETIPDATGLAQEVALKAAAEIAAQTEFAVIDASRRESVAEAAKRFDAIRHYAERAIQALSRLSEGTGQNL